jgi:hypothetical protein
MAPGDPQWNRAVKFGKSGEGLVQGTTVAVKFGDKDVRDGVRLMVPTGKKVINVSGTLFVTDKDNEQGKKLQETYTAATITTRHTNALHAAAEDLRRIKATGSLGAKERRLIENHMAQLAAVAKANWWKGFVDSGVMQEGESKRAEAATGAVGSIASRMSNYLNEKTGIDYDFGNDIDSIVQATTSLAAMTKPYNSLDLAHRLGFREIKSGPAFGYDSNGNPVDARSLPKGSPLYMIGDM